ncbi:MAG: AraC family transcriptional regulator [Lachnospiraceae bacterium]|nr:AraC family transcriptional regulator [Lachnospiraceae bacterium]
MNQNVEAVNRMKQYIAGHLQVPITARDIANAAGYSQYHAARIFKKETNLSPFEYIRRQRLIASAHTLRREKKKVLDVALDFAFDSHEGFTRAFTNCFGVSPKKYSATGFPKCASLVNRTLNSQITESEDQNMNTIAIFTQIVERPARKLLLKLSKAADDYFSYVAEVGCGAQNNSTVWDALTEIKEALYEPVGLWLPENMRPGGTGIYAHGVELPADYSGEIPSGFDLIDLKPCKLMIFQGEPYNDEDFETAVLGCMEKIDIFNPKVYGYEWAPKDAPRMQLNPEGWRGYIELRPVTEAKFELLD